ncbi:hypothetical protein M3Y94_00093300 [Aphelenchoides besseyi]|nr:hypothetical protein M3Y94_00093300 [Aphelenchoides besseyi]KAI6237676.1 hypothetical protein M3Y95_00290400 [Aphelenchoides besseyi]
MNFVLLTSLLVFPSLVNGYDLYVQRSHYSNQDKVEKHLILEPNEEVVFDDDFKHYGHLDHELNDDDFNYHSSAKHCPRGTKLKVIPYIGHVCVHSKRRFPEVVSVRLYDDESLGDFYSRTFDSRRRPVAFGPRRIRPVGRMPFSSPVVSISSSRNEVPKHQTRYYDGVGNVRIVHSTDPRNE